MIDGMGIEQETTTNAAGGSQSDIPYRFDLIDAKAMFEMAKVLKEGADKYGEQNWRVIPVEDHLNHALAHIFAYLAGDTQDDHLSHILCRATFALGVKLQVEIPHKISALTEEEAFYLNNPHLKERIQEKRKYLENLVKRDRNIESPLVKMGLCSEACSEGHTYFEGCANKSDYL